MLIIDVELASIPVDIEANDNRTLSSFCPRILLLRCFYIVLSIKIHLGVTSQVIVSLTDQFKLEPNTSDYSCSVRIVCHRDAVCTLNRMKSQNTKDEIGSFTTIVHDNFFPSTRTITNQYKRNLTHTKSYIECEHVYEREQTRIC
jgi:hypothetical protein